MRSRVILLAALLFVTVPATGQEVSEPGDSLTTIRVLLLDPGIALGKPTIVFPPNFRPDPDYARSQLLRPFFQRGPSFFDMRPLEKADLLSPYLLGLERDKELSTLHTILGAVSLGAVAYVAYRHVQKYGF